MLWNESRRNSRMKPSPLMPTTSLLHGVEIQARGRRCFERVHAVEPHTWMVNMMVGVLRPATVRFLTAMMDIVVTPTLHSARACCQSRVLAVT